MVVIDYIHQIAWELDNLVSIFIPKFNTLLKLLILKLLIKK